MENIRIKKNNIKQARLKLAQAKQELRIAKATYKLEKLQRACEGEAEDIKNIIEDLEK